MTVTTDEQAAMEAAREWWTTYWPFRVEHVAALILAQRREVKNGINPPCSQCGGPHPFDTTVPSVVWNATIRAGGLPDYLCLTCIVRAFASSGESFTAELIGEAFPGGVPIEVRIRERVATDAARISEENTELRARIARNEEALLLRVRDLENGWHTDRDGFVIGVDDSELRTWLKEQIDEFDQGEVQGYEGATRKAAAMQETLDTIATLVGVPVPGRDGGALLARISWLVSQPIPNGVPLATLEDVLRMLREYKPDPHDPDEIEQFQKFWQIVVAEHQDNPLSIGDAYRLKRTLYEDRFGAPKAKGFPAPIATRTPPGPPDPPRPEGDHPVA